MSFAVGPVTPQFSDPSLVGRSDKTEDGTQSNATPAQDKTAQDTSQSETRVDPAASTAPAQPDAVAPVTDSAPGVAAPSVGAEQPDSTSRALVQASLAQPEPTPDEQALNDLARAREAAELYADTATRASWIEAISDEGTGTPLNSLQVSQAAQDPFAGPDDGAMAYERPGPQGT